VPCKWQTLGCQKVCCHWISHLLTDEYQKGSNDVTLQLLKRHAAEFNNFLLNNMTSIKSWFHNFDTRIVAKRGTALCHTFNEEMAKTMSSACKVTGNFSLDTMICLLVYFLPWWKTISASCYIQILHNLWCALHKMPLLKRHIIFQHGNAQPHTVSLILGTNVKYRYGVLLCPPYSPDLALLRLWPIWDLGKLDEGLALWEWCGYPGVMHTFFEECWTGHEQQHCIKVHRPLQEMHRL